MLKVFWINVAKFKAVSKSIFLSLLCSFQTALSASYSARSNVIASRSLDILSLDLRVFNVVVTSEFSNNI